VLERAADEVLGIPVFRLRSTLGERLEPRLERQGALVDEARVRRAPRLGRVESNDGAVDDQARGLRLRERMPARARHDESGGHRHEAP
jgi:hypothetical protein